MRRHEKAATAGSNRRGASKRKPGLLLICLAACVAALAVVVGSASASKTHLFKEAFGPSAQPSFTTPRGIAIDQGTGEVYVIDAGSPPSVKRYNEDGTASDFSALASNAIDGAGGADETPQGALAFGAANRVQIAIDESGTATDGDIYVAQQSSKLLDVFDSTGTYKGQLTESSEGLLGEICGVAVDSAGKLYLGDIAGKIHVYTPAANPPVNGDGSANFATVASPCQIAAGTGATAGFLFVNRSTGELKKVDAATGEVKYAIGGTSHRTVYVNPATGHLYAPRATGGSSEVVEYDASGAGSATTVSSFKPGSTIEGVAVRASDANVLITRQGQANAQLYGATVTQPDVTSTAVSNNTGTRATLNGTVNPDEVELSECFFEWSLSSGSFENTAPCAESNATIGAGTSPAAVHADITGLTPQGTQYKYRLVAKNPESPAVTGSQQSFSTPNTVVTTAATGTTLTEATLNGTVNPDTVAITECAFEWGPQKSSLELIQQYPESAPCVPGPGGIGTGTSPVAVEADLTALHPGTTYVYRLRAANAGGPIVGDPLTLQTVGPVIAATWSEDVVITEATLKAQIDPEGKATTYHFEYGTSAAYGTSTPELTVGSDSSIHEVTRSLEGLTPGTTYHYRAVVESADGLNEGPDRVFTTYAPATPDTDCPNQAHRIGAAANLPDCRAYELVSPVDKNGGDIVTRCDSLCYRTALNQASADGNAITYSSYKAFGDAVGNLYSNQYLARRGPDGWETHGLSPLHHAVLTFPFQPAWDLEVQFKAFTDDLSAAWLTDDADPPLTADAVEGEVNLYRRGNLSDSYQPLFTEPPTSGQGELGRSMMMEGHSASGDHAIFSIRGAYTPDAAAGSKRQLYDFAGGKLHLVSVLPNGLASTTNSGSGNGNAGSTSRDDNVSNAVSDDGSRIYWTANSNSTQGKVYVRVDGEQTVAVSETISTQNAEYLTASTDGSKALFRIGANLYLFDLNSESSTLVAGGLYGVMGAGDSLERFYFVSSEALAAGATLGERNLYLDDAGALKFIASLSPVDTGDGGALKQVSGYDVVAPEPITRASRVSRDGRVAAFQSVASLTGYDNTNTAAGESNLEVFVYDDNAEQLYCVSCRASGARAEGRPLQKPFRALEDDPANNNGGPERRWTAAWLTTAERPTYTPRALSDDGKRLFFNAFDALLPRDTNGQQDVYEWQAEGAGCEQPEGCLRLISSGKGADAAEFVDASPDGRDVFFSTGSSLVSQDPGLIDIYNAREGGGFSPPPPAGPECIGDACQHVPTPPSGFDAASASFRGAGSVVRTAADCGSTARRAARLNGRARGLRRKASRSASPRRARALRRRSARLVRRARGLSKQARRCRRASRRAGR